MDIIERMPISGHTFRSKLGLTFRARCIGGRDWSLKDLYSPHRQTELGMDLGREMHALGAEQVLAPTPGFNAEFIARDRLTTRIPLTQDYSVTSLSLWRNKAEPADCAPLFFKGCAGVFSAGGCPLVLGVHEANAVFAHAGQQSVFDPGLVMDEGATRTHESVANTILHALGNMARHYLDPSDVEVWVIGSIKGDQLSHDLDHPEHGTYNKALVRYGQRYANNAVSEDGRKVYVDLPRVLEQQFLALGVRGDKIFVDETSYVPEDLPTTRNGGGTRRYLAAIVRTS